jgi:hypothetical protein
MSESSDRVIRVVDVWVATYDEERTVLEQAILDLKQLGWPSDKLDIFVQEGCRG